jgi:hypothetical protein
VARSRPKDHEGVTGSLHTRGRSRTQNWGRSACSCARSTSGRSLGRYAAARAPPLRTDPAERLAASDRRRRGGVLHRVLTSANSGVLPADRDSETNGSHHPAVAGSMRLRPEDLAL